MYRPIHRFLPPGLVALVLFCVPPCRADHDQIRFEPAFPTWLDPVTVVVETEDRGCGLARLGEPEIIPLGGGEFVYEIELEDPCAIGIPAPRPVTLSTVIDPVRYGEGEYLVRIRHGETGHVTESDLRVFGVAEEALSVERPAHTGMPVEIVVKAFGPCSHLRDPEIRDSERVVVVDYGDECNILPPGPMVRSVRARVGPLDPGRWTIVVVDREEGEAVREEVVVHDARRCVPSDTRLCLNQGRFAVEASWRDFEDRTGPAHARPLSDLEDSGLMWFFHESNLELTVKVLNGCGANGHWWVFLSSGSTVEYELRVTDTMTGETRTYGNRLGEFPTLIPDTRAFPCSVDGGADGLGAHFRRP